MKAASELSLIVQVQMALQGLGHLHKGNYGHGEWDAATNNIYRSWCANNSSNRWAHQPLSLADVCPVLRKIMEGGVQEHVDSVLVTPEPIPDPVVEGKEDTDTSGFNDDIRYNDKGDEEDLLLKAKEKEDIAESPYTADDFDFEPEVKHVLIEDETDYTPEVEADNDRGNTDDDTNISVFNDDTGDDE